MHHIDPSANEVVKMRCAALVLGIVFALAIAASAQGFVNVTSDPHYQTLARSYQPTILHESGETFFPAAWDCDGDSNPSNNASTYSRSCPRTVYTHILRDTNWGYVFIQYWYYYAYNPCPAELLGFLSRRIPPIGWPLSVPIDALLLLYIEHPQDWELAMVILDGAENPVSFVLGAHGELHPYAWSSVGKVPGARTHPFAYAYQGSHAMHWSPSPQSPWYWGVETWSGGGSYTTWEGTCQVFVGSGSGLPYRFGDYSAPWRRSIWSSVPQYLDGAAY